MPTIISMQDIRTSLASVAQRTSAGESFVVVRNSKPAFRIEPLSGGEAPISAPLSAGRSLDSITGRIDAVRSSATLTEDELDQIIHDVHGCSGQA